MYYSNNGTQQPYDQNGNGQWPRPQYQPPMQLRFGGLYPVRSMDEARRYPVEPGVVMVFPDVNAPYIYTKAQRAYGTEPEFRIFRDENFFPAQQPQQNQQHQTGEYVKREEWDKLAARLEDMEAAMSKKRTAAKKEEETA